jgi:SAM-dependent methyltransferase
VLEYVRNDKKLIKEIWRVLKPGGICFISVPNQKSIFRRVEKIRFFLRKLIKKTDHLNGYLSYQQHQYDLRSFVALIEASKLQLLESRYFGLSKAGDWFGGIPEQNFELIGTMILGIMQKPLRLYRHDLNAPYMPM